MLDKVNLEIEAAELGEEIKAKGELSAAEFELESLKARVEDIDQTRKEIENVCNECLKVIEENDDAGVKNKILAIGEVPRLIAEISTCLGEMRPLFTTAYDIYAAPRTTRTTTGKVSKWIMIPWSESKK